MSLNFPFMSLLRKSGGRWDFAHGFVEFNFFEEEPAQVLAVEVFLFKFDLDFFV